MMRELEKITKARFVKKMGLDSLQDQASKDAVLKALAAISYAFGQVNGCGGNCRCKIGGLVDDVDGPI